MNAPIMDGYRIVTLRTDAVYKPKEPLEVPVFAYIRECREDEVGFSVIERIERNPDFSNCGIFWLSPIDFDEFFEEV